MDRARDRTHVCAHIARTDTTVHGRLSLRGVVHQPCARSLPASPHRAAANRVCLLACVDDVGLHDFVSINRCMGEYVANMKDESSGDAHRKKELHTVAGRLVDTLSSLVDAAARDYQQRYARSLHESSDAISALQVGALLRSSKLYRDGSLDSLQMPDRAIPKLLAALRRYPFIPGGLSSPYARANDDLVDAWMRARSSFAHNGPHLRR